MKNLILILAMAVSAISFGQKRVNIDGWGGQSEIQESIHEITFKVLNVSYSYWDEEIKGWGQFEYGKVDELNSNIITMHENCRSFLIPSKTQGNILIELGELVGEETLDGMKSIAFDSKYHNREGVFDVHVVIQDLDVDKAVFFVAGNNMVIAYEMIQASKQPQNSRNRAY